MRNLRFVLVAGVLGLATTGCLTDAELLALRVCESGNNYRAVSDSGKYRGAYQFDLRTWREVGGKGDPIDASPAEQDWRASILYEKAGRGRWPVCGKKLPA